TPASSAITFTDMMPGDTFTHELVVISVLYMSKVQSAAPSSSTNADAKGLKDQLVLTVKTVDVTTPATPCDNFDGTQLYTGDLDRSEERRVGKEGKGRQAGDQ